ncbi:MAG: bifunctional demethylmenaquinone methyltransferase/2-methoxy-6-polyprenyl-1,4-benzoquinol methylase UbiE [Planctomycetes bacterium]|nr:bifunctional demethylmenaquinone methyltransferase/2-methoxy-6-polyprenyl-1,4-benzoquinol methylase UbiE [Planctomycetota bacterium]
MTATVDKSNERVQKMFGEIAPRYDLLNHLLSMNTDKYWRRQTVRLAPPEGDAPILDVCTGTGDLAFAYYKRTRGEVEIVGSDFCPEMLAIGDQKKEKLGCDGQITFVEADSQNLPFDDDRFQLVTVAFGLRNVADTDRGLREMTRVCMPGGRVAVLEFSMPGWQPFKAIYGFYFLKVLPKIGQWMMRNKQEAYSYLPKSVGQFPCGEALSERMRGAGLSEVRFHPMTLGIATLYVGTKPERQDASTDEADS